MKTEEKNGMKKTRRRRKTKRRGRRKCLNSTHATFGKAVVKAILQFAHY